MLRAMFYKADVPDNSATTLSVSRQNLLVDRFKHFEQALP